MNFRVTPCVVRHDMKICNKCKAEKKEEEFSIDKRNPSGLSYRCKECDRKRVREYSKKNRNKINDRFRTYRKNNKEKLKLRNSEYYNSNKEKIKTIVRTWTRNNKDKVNEYSRNYRSRRYSKESGYISSKEWSDLKRKYNFHCLSCKRKEPIIKLELDHVLPLSLGGKNIIENAQPLCKSCNCKKGAKHMDFRVMP